MSTTEVTLDFDKIFASNCSTGELQEFTNYTRGWGYLGKDVAPPMEDFNYLQWLTDLKAQYLYNTKLDIDDTPTELKCPNTLKVIVDSDVYEYDGSKDVLIGIELATENDIANLVV